MATTDLIGGGAERRDFYVYVIFRLDSTPAYVGKGRNGRWRQHHAKASNTNVHLKRLLAVTPDMPVLKVRVGLTDAQAKATEIELISAFKRRKHGGPLTNMTDGGDGKVGYITKAETKALIKIANTGKKPTEETRARMSLSKKGKPQTAEHVSRRAATHIGSKRTEETCALIRFAATANSAATSVRVRDFHAAMTAEQKAERSARISAAVREAMTPEVCAKISAGKKGKPGNRTRGRTGMPHTEETKAKMAASWQQKYADGWTRGKHTPETRAKMSASQQRNAAARRAANGNG